MALGGLVTTSVGWEYMKKYVLFAAVALLSLIAFPASAQEPNFGRAVVLEGEDLLVGQPVNWYGPGMVYVYRMGAGGQWMEQELLSAPDSVRKDDFGRTLAKDGNTLAVGAPRKRDGSGVVYIFDRSSGTSGWELSAVVEPPQTGDHTEYGAALALSGDELLIGSPAAEETGVVYRFVRSGDVWQPSGMVRPAAGTMGFGSTLSRSGDHMLVGSPRLDSGRGAAWIVSRTAQGWGAPGVIEVPTALAERAGFGASVLMEEGRGFIGASGAGSVHVLQSNGSGGWALTGTVASAEAGDRSSFGFSMARAGSELWVGAPGQADNDGRVYRFTETASGAWQAAGRLDPDETAGTSWPLGFGYSLALSETNAVVGMPTRDFGEGRAMALSRAGNDWSAGTILEGRIFRLGEQLNSGDRCLDGEMAEFDCSNMELVSHMPISDLGGERGVWVNDVWGWTDAQTGRRYALVARRDGASFVDVTNPAAPELLGNLPRTPGSRPSVWRDIKVIDNYAFIVADGAGAHGMQVFDLTRLRDVREFTEFEPEITYHDIFSAHNVVADTESGFVYVVGANSGGQTCGGGLHIVDVRDPLEPSFAGCYHDPTAGNGYTHDAQCLVYNGPDENYRGREICLGSNASELNIADVTDKANPVTISRASYPNVAYAHQGWLDDEHRYFYMNDEGDETAGLAERTRTMVWDLTDLEDPQLVNQYFGPVPASDHNLFVVGNRMYQSNYGSGLRVLDISDRANPREIAFFDSAPFNNDEPGFSAAQSGAWSNYPFFPDGLVIFTSVREGLFIVRVDRPIT